MYMYCNPAYICVQENFTRFKRYSSLWFFLAKTIKLSNIYFIYIKNIYI